MFYFFFLLGKIISYTVDNIINCVHIIIGVQSMFSRHHIFAEGRTVSLDRFKYTISREEKTMAPKKMLINMQKQSSFGEYARASPAPVRRLTGEALFGK